MKIDILTLFPEMFEALNHSILARAQKNNLLEIKITNIRDYTKNKNKRCDDYSYGGGAGMIMTPQPLYDCINAIKQENEENYVIYLSPKGRLLKQKRVEELAKKHNHIILVCGHYEGIDERIIELCVDEELSIGDYVLTGGELPAMVLTDAIARYIPDVLGNEETTSEESFSKEGLLEYPQYTRPSNFMGLEVPQVLLDGNHGEVAKWRETQSRKITLERRPDLIKNNDK